MLQWIADHLEAVIALLVFTFANIASVACLIFTLGKLFGEFNALKAAVLTSGIKQDEHEAAIQRHDAHFAAIEERCKGHEGWIAEIQRDVKGILQ